MAVWIKLAKKLKMSIQQPLIWSLTKTNKKVYIVIFLKLSSLYFRVHGNSVWMNGLWAFVERIMYYVSTNSALRLPNGDDPWSSCMRSFGVSEIWNGKTPSTYILLLDFEIIMIKAKLENQSSNIKVHPAPM